jgi:hypothetical protein
MQYLVFAWRLVPPQSSSYLALLLQIIAKRHEGEAFRQVVDRLLSELDCGAPIKLSDAIDAKRVMQVVEGTVGPFVSHIADIPLSVRHLASIVLIFLAIRASKVIAAVAWRVCSWLATLSHSSPSPTSGTGGNM